MAMGTHTPGKRGRGMRGRSRGTPMAEINVTPLVDVMLVLLIIFMVTAPLLTSGVPLDLPETNAKPRDQPQKPPVQISIRSSDELFIDDKPVTMAELPAKLEAIAAAQNERDPQAIMVRGDRAVDYGFVMRVMGELNAAGLNRVSLVTTGSATEN